MILTSPAGADAAFLMLQLLLSGKSSTTISKLVDNFGVYARTKEDAKKRKKIRPSKGEVAAVVEAAFRKHPRLGTYVPRAGDREVLLKAWSTSEKGQRQRTDVLLPHFPQ